MTHVPSLSGLLVALFLPWLCGCVWASWLLRRTARCNWFIVLGQGYFLGIFAVTLLIRAWDILGFELYFWGIASTLALSGVLGAVLILRRPVPGGISQAVADVVPRWQVAVATLLLLLVAWRYVTMLQEILQRPLFAWDAWMNWAPKAITWFHQGSLVEFVDPEQWWLSSAPDVYTLGNRQASTYPAMVPLIQLWSMLGAGTWDHSSIYLPWLLAPIALGFALYGHLRLAAVPYLMAVIAVYLLLSLPYLNVHTVLVGYADLWLAAAFGLAVCALSEWRHSRHWAYAVLWLLLAIMCSQLKVPGLVLALIILVFGVLGLPNFSPRQEFAVLVLGGGLVALTLLIGVNLELPYLGRVTFADGVFEVEKIGRFALEYHSVGASFLDSLLVMINWNLWWYLTPVFLIYLYLPGHGVRRPMPELLPVMAALAFVAFVFVFTKHFQAALNLSTLNRALLYPVPAMVFCCFLCFQKREAGV